MADTTLEQFTSDATAFLASHCEHREDPKARVWGEGSDKVAVFEEKSKDAERRDVEASKQWRQTMFDAGFGWITGPTQYGGRALPGSYQRAFDDGQGLELMT